MLVEFDLPNSGFKGCQLENEYKEVIDSMI